MKLDFDPGEWISNTDRWSFEANRHAICEFAQQHGVNPDPAKLEAGIINRCPVMDKAGDRTTGFVGITTFQYRGRYATFRAVVGDWREFAETGALHTYSPINEELLSHAERNELRAREAEARVEFEREAEKQRATGRAEAQKVYDAAEMSKGAHVYLLHKRVPGAPGLVEDNGDLLIPLHTHRADDPGLVSYQRIRVDGDGFSKRFAPNCTIKTGGYFVIGDVNQARRVFVCEGYATAASLNLCLETDGADLLHHNEPYAVAVAFALNRMERVAEWIRDERPGRVKPQIILVADNDWQKAENRGFTATLDAATRLRCGFVAPRFLETAATPASDVNDLVREYGRSMATSILTSAYKWKVTPEVTKNAGALASAATSVEEMVRPHLADRQRELPLALEAALMDEAAAADGQPQLSALLTRRTHGVVLVPGSVLVKMSKLSAGWIIEDWIPAGSVVTALYGAGGIGKTMLLQQLGVCLATGTPFVGLDIAKKRRVLAFFLEDAADIIGERYERMCAGMGLQQSVVDEAFCQVPYNLAGDDLNMAYTDSRSGNVVEGPFVNELYKSIEQWRPDVVLLDNLSQLFSGNENSKSEATQFVRLCRRIADEMRCTIIIAAHPSFAGIRRGDGMSGSVGWDNAYRSRMYLQDGDVPMTRKLGLLKANYREGGGGIEIMMHYRDGQFQPGFPPKVVISAEGRLEMDRHYKNRAAALLSILATREDSNLKVSDNMSSPNHPVRLVLAAATPEVVQDDYGLKLGDPKAQRRHFLLTLNELREQAWICSKVDRPLACTDEGRAQLAAMLAPPPED